METAAPTRLHPFRLPDSLQWRESSRNQWQGRPFPFKSVDDRATNIATDLTSCFETRALAAIPPDFPSLIAINDMFEEGYMIPARSAVLAKIASSHSKAAAYTVGKEWNMGQAHIDSIIYGQAEIEKLIEKDSITINDLAAMPPQTLALQGYIVQELSDIAQGVKAADPSRLDRLAHITDLYFANANDEWASDGRSLNGVFNAMAGALKDVAFWTKHPETYAFMSEITQAVSGIAPAERYHYEHLTALVTSALLKHKIVKRSEFAHNKLRVIGSVKPIASATLKVDMAVNTIISDIFLAAKAMGLAAPDARPQTPDQTLSMLDLILQNAQSIPPDSHIMNRLIEQLYEQRAVGYDQQRCRIQVADKKTFNSLVKRMHSRLEAMKWGARVGQLFTPGPNPYNLEDYMRTSVYDGENPPIREKNAIPKRPADFITHFLHTMAPNHVGYAAYHHWGPFYIPTVSGRTHAVNFETQITLGGGPIERDETRGAMEQMWKMAGMAYYHDGNYTAAGITPEYIGAVNKRAKQEALTI